MSDRNRRDFLKGTAWMLSAAAAGCVNNRPFGEYPSVANFTVPPMTKVRIGFVGVGERGTWAVKRISNIPGTETAALCDLRPQQIPPLIEYLNKKKSPGTLHTYAGKDDSWKGLCDDAAVDIVYLCTPADLHARMAVYAMNAGKHVMVEVPAAKTLDDCWAIVEASERNRVHCMMLENCVYGENELLAWNLCHQGLLGTLTHAEGGYIHLLTWRHLENHFRNRHHQKPGTVVHTYGNSYPTHALGPICTYMDMNRGDRMEKVVSMSSLSAGHREFARHFYKPDDWQNNIEWRTGDMNTSIIRTALGRTIMMQIDMSTPRPYSRINLIQGTKGCFYDYPLRITYSDEPGGQKGHEWFDKKKLENVRKLHMHPLYKDAGEIAKKIGGHGGMDFMMDLRWVFCLQNGLPLDMDVYDLASWSSIVPCSADSDRRGGEVVELPDFTRGAWKTAKPISIGSIDITKMGLENAHR